MMTLSKALAAGQAKDYFDAEYTSTQESYYSEGEVVKGKWVGRQAEAWQLQGEVTSEHFERLCEGQHPLSGDQLVRHVTPHKYENAYGETIETANTERAGMQPSRHRRVSHSLPWLAATNEYLKLTT